MSKLLRQLRLVALLSLALQLSWQVPAAVGFWDDSILINTEAFHQLDVGDGSSDIELQFGTNVNQKLLYDTSSTSFIFRDQLRVYGDITNSGSLFINADQTGDATLTFGQSVNETLIFASSANRFEASDDIYGSGSIIAQTVLSGSNLVVSDSVQSNLIPSIDLGWELGNDSRRWKNIFTDGLQVSSGSVITIGTVSGSLLPSSGSIFDLGSADNRWRTVFADNIVFENSSGSVNSLNLGGQGGISVEFNNNQAGVGVTMTTGAVVIVDTSSGDSVLLSTSQNDEPIGVALNDAMQGEKVEIMILGKSTIQCTGAIAIGDTVQTSNVDGAAKKGANAGKVIGSSLSTCTGGEILAIIHLE